MVYSFVLYDLFNGSIVAYQDINLVLTAKVVYFPLVKPQLMRKVYLPLFLVLFFSSSLFAASYKGYLVTKNNFHLTGFVQEVTYTPGTITVTFANDFGNVYYIHPALVKGFAFVKDNQLVSYVSRYHQGQWYFLEVITDGELISLFEIPPTSAAWVDDTFQSVTALDLDRYWVQIRRQAVQPVRRWGFRKQMRRLLSLRQPELSRKIGSSGYRYRDLQQIIAECNERFRRKSRRL